MTTRDALIKILAKEFPKMWMKPAEDFGGGYDSKAIWTGEGSENNDEEPMFDIYSDNSIYNMGVHKDLVAILDKHDYYAEAYDGGTYFISPN